MYALWKNYDLRNILNKKNVLSYVWRWSMREILNIINQLSNTNSRTEKENILRINSNNQLLKDILKFTYDPFIVSGLSKKKINKNTKVQYTIELNTIEEAMRYIQENNTGRDIDIANLHHFINKHDSDVQKFLKQVFTKDLKIGCDAKTINKVYGKGFIPEFNVMLAEKYVDHEDKVVGDFIITEKLDGIRCVLIKENGIIKMFSRQGQPLEGLVEIEKEAQLLPDNMVFDGELILINPKNLNSADLYRETVKVVRKDGIKHNIIFHVFDMLSIDEFKNGISYVPCIQRKNAVHDYIDGKYQYIKEVPMLHVDNDKEVIWLMLNDIVSKGKEGLMLNLADAPYECKRTKNILKIKKFADADVRVVDIIEGTGQNKGKLGAITIQFLHNGKLYECNCGSGFSQEERELYWNKPELVLGKICTIGYFEVTKNQQGSYGLRFPTWKGIIRDDKDEISMY